MNPLNLAVTADLIESGISTIVSIDNLLVNPHVLEEEDGSTEFADTRQNQDVPILIFSVCAHAPSEQEEVEELVWNAEVLIQTSLAKYVLSITTSTDKVSANEELNIVPYRMKIMALVFHALMVSLLKLVSAVLQAKDTETDNADHTVNPQHLYPRVSNWQEFKDWSEIRQAEIVEF